MGFIYDVCDETFVLKWTLFFYIAVAATSFPGLSYEDEARHEKALVWAGHVTAQKWQYLTATRQGVARYSLMKYTSLRNKSVNSQKTSQSILFLCRAKFGTNQLKSLKTPSMFSKIYRYF